MFFLALGSFHLYSMLRRSVAYSLSVASCPRQFQFAFSAPVISRIFLECCLMPSAIQIYSPLRRSLVHSSNVASCPRQFQFAFSAPVVSRTFLECCLMPSAIAIYIPCSGGHSQIP